MPGSSERRWGDGGRGSSRVKVSAVGLAVKLQDRGNAGSLWGSIGTCRDLGWRWMSVSGVREAAWDAAWKGKQEKKCGYRQNLFGKRHKTLPLESRDEHFLPSPKKMEEVVFSVCLFVY